MKKLSRNSLLSEMLLILAVKIALLAVIWLAFFSHPEGRVLSADEVGRAMLEAKHH